MSAAGLRAQVTVDGIALPEASAVAGYSHKMAYWPASGSVRFTLGEQVAVLTLERTQHGLEGNGRGCGFRLYCRITCGRWDRDGRKIATITAGAAGAV